MITFHKPVLAAGVPAILGTVFLATALGAAENMAENTEKPIAPKEVISTEAEAQPTGKGDLKVNLADVHSRPTRCVSGDAQTTCTGWPVSAAMLAYKD